MRYRCRRSRSHRQSAVRVEESIDIRCARQGVWDIVCDPTNDPRCVRRSGRFKPPDLRAGGPCTGRFLCARRSVCCWNSLRLSLRCDCDYERKTRSRCSWSSIGWNRSPKARASPRPASLSGRRCRECSTRPSRAAFGGTFERSFAPSRRSPRVPESAAVPAGTCSRILIDRQPERSNTS